MDYDILTLLIVMFLASASKELGRHSGRKIPSMIANLTKLLKERAADLHSKILRASKKLGEIAEKNKRRPKYWDMDENELRDLAFSVKKAAEEDPDIDKELKLLMKQLKLKNVPQLPEGSADLDRARQTLDISITHLIEDSTGSRKKRWLIGLFVGVVMIVSFLVLHSSISVPPRECSIERSDKTRVEWKSVVCMVKDRHRECRQKCDELTFDIAIETTVNNTGRREATREICSISEDFFQERDITTTEEYLRQWREEENYSLWWESWRSENECPAEKYL